MGECLTCAVRKSLNKQVLGGGIGLSAGMWFLGIRAPMAYAVVGAGHFAGHVATRILSP